MRHAPRVSSRWSVFVGHGAQPREPTQEANAAASNDGGQGACFHVSHGAAACGQGPEDIANHLEIRGVGLSSMSIRTYHQSKGNRADSLDLPF